MATISTDPAGASAATRHDLRSTGETAAAAGSEPGHNTVILEGELAAPVDVRDLPSGTVLAVLTVRVPGPTNRKTSIPVTVWEPSVAVQSLQEGSRVGITGRVVRRFWAGPDGGRRSRVEVVGERIEALDN